jgi:hypothetical protein
MSRFDIWLDRFAKVSCIGSLISQIVFGILGVRVVSQTPSPIPAAPTDHRPLYYFLGWIISILYSATMAYFIFRRKGEIDSTESHTENDNDDFEQRDQLRSELEQLKAQKPDTSVGDSDPQLEIKFNDLRGKTVSKDRACFDLINRSKKSSANLACIDDFSIGAYRVAFRSYPPRSVPVETTTVSFPSISMIRRESYQSWISSTYSTRHGMRSKTVNYMSFQSQ